MTRENPNEDMITRMARDGLGIAEQFDSAVHEHFGTSATLDVNEVTQAYLDANFEQRHQMFLQIFSAEGPDGLEFLAEVMANAHEIYEGGANGLV